MSKRVHFEDDLYFIASTIKTLRNGMSLDIDPEYFIDRLVEDVFFIDTTLDLLCTALKENEHLIGRQEYLRHMLSLKRAYVDFLAKICSRELKFGEHLEPFFEKFLAMRDRQLKDITEIGTLISIAGSGESGELDIVSSDELTELLRSSGDEKEEI